MNVELINKLHAVAREAEAAMSKLLATNDESSEACDNIDDPRSSIWHAWGDYIVKIGKALRESREQHGADWEKVYDSLGYAFGYKVACQYIHCARYQDAADYHHTFAEWAAVAAEYDEVDRVNQAAGVVHKSRRAWELADRTGWTDDTYSLLLVFEQLDLVICCLPQYAALKNRWQALADAIRDGVLPAPDEEPSYVGGEATC